MTAEKATRSKAGVLADPVSHDVTAGRAVPQVAPSRAIEAGSADLARVLDVKVELSVELGRRKIRISDVLDLGPGSVIEFGKPAEEPLDIFVNDQLVARGEAVVLSGRYGVRIVEVVSPNERLRTSGSAREVTP